MRTPGKEAPTAVVPTDPLPTGLPFGSSPSGYWGGRSARRGDLRNHFRFHGLLAGARRYEESESGLGRI